MPKKQPAIAPEQPADPVPELQRLARLARAILMIACSASSETDGHLDSTAEEDTVRGMVVDFDDSLYAIWRWEPTTRMVELSGLARVAAESQSSPCRCRGYQRGRKMCSPTIYGLQYAMEILVRDVEAAIRQEQREPGASLKPGRSEGVSHAA